MFQGEGANGKSVLLDTLTAVIGAENASHSSLGALGQEFGLAPLLGKLVNIAAEIEAKSFDEELLKKLVGGEPVTVNRKRRDQQDARLKARLLFASNNLPRFNDRTIGMLRRAIIIPCGVTIPPEKQDLDLADKLKAELSGIFNWAMRGLDRLRRQGTFTEPPACKTALEAHREQSNPTRAFLLEHYEPATTGKVPKPHLYDRYTEWCKANGYKPLDAMELGKEVKRAFPAISTTKTALEGTSRRLNTYVGIRFKPDITEPFDGESGTQAAVSRVRGLFSGTNLNPKAQAMLEAVVQRTDKAERTGSAPVVDVYPIR